MIAAESKSSIQVIERMMRLLEVLARHPEPVGLKALAQSASGIFSTAACASNFARKSMLNSRNFARAA